MTQPTEDCVYYATSAPTFALMDDEARPTPTYRVSYVPQAQTNTPHKVQPSHVNRIQQIQTSHEQKQMRADRQYQQQYRSQLQKTFSDANRTKNLYR